MHFVIILTKQGIKWYNYIVHLVVHVSVTWRITNMTIALQLAIFALTMASLILV